MTIKEEQMNKSEELAKLLGIEPRVYRDSSQCYSGYGDQCKKLDYSVDFLEEPNMKEVDNE